MFEKNNGASRVDPECLSAHTGPSGPASTRPDPPSDLIGSAGGGIDEAPTGGGGEFSSSFSAQDFAVGLLVHPVVRGERFAYFQPQQLLPLPLSISPLHQPYGSRCSATTLIIGIL